MYCLHIKYTHYHYKLPSSFLDNWTEITKSVKCGNVNKPFFITFSMTKYVNPIQNKRENS